MQPALIDQRYYDFDALGNPEGVLNAILNTSCVGFAVLDKKLRFRAVNKGLVTINRIAADAHIGKTQRTLFGKSASALEDPFRHVFSTGRPIPSLEICGKLPTRLDIGYWVVSYFPISDERGEVRQVGAVVTEISGQKMLQQSLYGIANKQIQNLLLAAHDAEAQLRHVRDNSRMRIPVDDSNSGQPGFAASRNQASFFRVQAITDGSEGSAPKITNTATGVPAPTAREREVVKLLTEGHGNKETARILGISVKTVETHRQRVMFKLGLSTAADLMRYAVTSKILIRTET